jgi:hypothetical protein
VRYVIAQVAGSGAIVGKGDRPRSVDRTASNKLVGADGIEPPTFAL